MADLLTQVNLGYYNGIPKNEYSRFQSLALAIGTAIKSISAGIYDGSYDSNIQMVQKALSDLQPIAVAKSGSRPANINEYNSLVEALKIININTPTISREIIDGKAIVSLGNAVYEAPRTSTALTTEQKATLLNDNISTLNTTQPANNQAVGFTSIFPTAKQPPSISNLILLGGALYLLGGKL